MKNLTTLLVSLTAAAGLLACGDDLKPAGSIDAPKAPDAFVPPTPPAPTLGAQIDRMGRPAVNTALNALLDPDPLKTAKKDAYNHAADRTMWSAAVTNPAGMDMVPYSPAPKTVRSEFAKQLAILDALDQGLFPGVANPSTPGTPPGTEGPGEGCYNGALHDKPAGSGYLTLASVLADDQLYVDTAKLTCNFYLSLEVEVATGRGVRHSQCGGRTPTHDVIDTSYSLLAAGTNGFDLMLAPKIKDGVDAHTDVNNNTFPFLGAPH